MIKSRVFWVLFKSNTLNERMLRPVLIKKKKKIQSVCRTYIKLTLKVTSLVAQLVKNLPAMQETWVRFLGWEDSLEKEMATHSSILAWRIPWTEEPGGLQSMGSQESDMT